MFYCVYNEWGVSQNHTKHIRQFREDKDGNRSGLFPDNRAVISLAKDSERYEVRNVQGELLFVGVKGYKEATVRIWYAQGSAVDITVNVAGKHRPLKEYEAAVAPVIFRIRYTHGKASDVYGVGMDVSKAGKVLAEWSFAKVGEGAISNEVIKIIDSFDGKGDNFAVVFSHKSLKPVVEHYGSRSDIPRQNFEHLVDKSRQARLSLEDKK